MLTFLTEKATAAHLALAAVAPFVLCKYLGDAAVIPVLLWISGIVLVWAFMAPARREEENSMIARSRVLRGVVVDPFFWVSVALVVYTAVAAFNSGAALAYDAEVAVWRLMPPKLSFLPGGVEGSGGLYAGSAILAFAVYPSVVHSLDGRQGMTFGIFACSAVVIDAVLAYTSGTGVARASGIGYGLWALVAESVMFASEKARDRVREMLSSVALCGCVAAMLIAGDPTAVCVFVAAAVLTAPVFVGFNWSELRAIGVIRALLMLFVSVALAAVIYHWRCGGDWEALIPVFEGVPDDPLTRLAVEYWEKRPWVGIGVGAFPIAAKIGATSQDWTVLGAMPDFYANGWRALLVERGMVGVLALAVSVGALAFSWFRGVRARGLANVSAATAMFPLALAAVSVSLVFGASALQADALVAFAALSALSVNGGV